jgi:hypothetical protein
MYTTYNSINTEGKNLGFSHMGKYLYLWGLERGPKIIFQPVAHFVGLGMRWLAWWDYEKTPVNSKAYRGL